MPMPTPDITATLLAEWETRACPVRSPAYLAARAHLLRQLDPLCVALTNCQADLCVDEEDVRTVLRHAISLQAGSAGTSGPGRAQRAARQAAAAVRASHLGPKSTGPAVVMLLAIISHPTAEFEMDELADIMDYFQQLVGNNQMEILFGHGLQPGLPTEIWVSVLLAYCPLPLPPQPPRLLQPRPPETDAATGRDFYFELAAHLFVQRGRASGYLLQRQFHLGYNRAHRLLDALAAAGIIARATDGSNWRVLVADEAALDGVLAQRPAPQSATDAAAC